MSDLGFVSNTEHQSAKSEPRAYTSVPKSQMTTLENQKCRCGKQTVLRYCLTHKKYEFFEESGNFRGDHNFLDSLGGPRYAEKDPEHRGSWSLHSCAASQELGDVA